ncbi:M15 family metallopeptidase [Deinococcus sonorensis]|uniref:M15 family metallopeptidase n=2 Tax=Deinococcus sonorensis TaxID=309891 RepID=A0ABV8Y7A2_9DEIO
MASLVLAPVAMAQPLTAEEQTRVTRLIQAYPDFLARLDGKELVWKDGTRMPLTHNATRSYSARLDQPGLLDQLELPYPACQSLNTPSFTFDPGRTRYEPLFFKMYGASAREVRSHLEPVNWFGQTVQVTGVNGAAASLRAVANEVAQHPELLRYVHPSAGTFLWRKVAGTPRQSVHSFGAAIDLNTAYSDYWLWRGFKEGQPGIRYRNRLPLALVQIFERHGWIWGGRWYHYDTMHFEYRPELTSAATCGVSAP